MKIVTQKLPGVSGAVVRYVQNSAYPFDPTCLDTGALNRSGLIDGEAAAGRGNTVFFTFHDQPLVLRHYRRGGLVRHLSERHYLYTGIDKTRAMREFDLLMLLHQQGLPAPVPYACSVMRRGLFYTASLVTHRLPGKTLAERLINDGCLSSDTSLDENLWSGIGKLIARFHTAGIFHADLNAHNIMLDDKGNIMLIDFDRGKRQALPKDPAMTGWCLDNVNRLERSLKKVTSSLPKDKTYAGTTTQNFSYLKEKWAECVSSLPDV